MNNDNLLIIGAGGQGHVCRETAQAMQVYGKIAFLDDASPDAIGKIGECRAFGADYRYAFVAIGNNKLRAELSDMLRDAGFEIPVLIHPRAFVSPSAQIGAGTIVAPMATVNTGSEVGEGCIISAGALIDHNAVIGRYTQIDAGAVCKSGSHVESFTKIQAGQIVSGY